MTTESGGVVKPGEESWGDGAKGPQPRPDYSEQPRARQPH